MAKHQMNDAVKIPETAFEITQHLGFSQEKKHSGLGMKLQVQ